MLKAIKIRLYPNKNQEIYINKDAIITAFEMANEEGGSLATVIYGGPTGSNWNVEEGLNKVVSLINKGS